jgi:hypothetical protein
MIVSHKHRFIFLKTRKTAGTSIEIALSEHCGPKDTISPNDPADEELRKELGFRGPQNRWVAPWKLGFTGLLGLIQRKEWAFHYNHCIAELVKHRVGASKFESYTRFCVVRNPWDRAVSMYWWNRNRTDGHAIDESIDFPTYVREAELKLLTDKDIFQIDGEAVVDHFVKFEELQEGLDSVMDDIGLPHLTLPRAKGGTRKTKQHYSLLYDDETMMIIANICAWEIKHFGYEFDDQRSADN